VASGGELVGCCALSVAVTEKANVPALLGVPARLPPLSRVMPGGRVPLAFQEYGGEPPLAPKLNPG
jgi:hypothetical protein